MKYLIPFMFLFSACSSASPLELKPGTCYHSDLLDYTVKVDLIDSNGARGWITTGPYLFSNQPLYQGDYEKPINCSEFERRKKSIEMDQTIYLLTERLTKLESQLKSKKRSK